MTAPRLSRVVSARARGDGAFSVRSVDLAALGHAASPVVVLDDFQVSGQPFAPHPHAGFSAVTYCFTHSPGGLRSRDSFGGDVRVGPGGIVWTQAGRGVMHEELPAEPGRALHGLQIFVALSARTQLAPPRVWALDGAQVPEWVSEGGDRVRVVVGQHAGVASPITPTEPFRLLDVELRAEVTLTSGADDHTLLYAYAGTVVVRAGAEDVSVAEGQLVAARGDGPIAIAGAPGARIIALGGVALHEPLVSHGPFILSDEHQIAAAIERYQRGEMGRLAPAART